MPKQGERPGRDYSEFDALSTETLKEILYQDSLLPDDEESDLDAILHIMEVIVEREAMEPTEAVTPVEEAWRQFNEYYRSEDCDGRSLYEDDPEEAEPVFNVIPYRAAGKARPKRRLRGALRVSCTAAVLILVLMAGSFTAYAMGYNVWETMAEWTQDVFRLVIVPEENSPAPSAGGPWDMLRDYGITEKVLPNWLPAGYQYVDTEIFDTPARTVLKVLYSNGEKEISMIIARLKDGTVYTHEKDARDITVYTVDGIEHFIVQNLEMVNVAWAVGNCECSIIGSISIEEARQMIDSIYGS